MEVYAKPGFWDINQEAATGRMRASCRSWGCGRVWGVRLEERRLKETEATSLSAVCEQQAVYYGLITGHANNVEIPKHPKEMIDVTLAHQLIRESSSIDVWTQAFAGCE